MSSIGMSALVLLALMAFVAPALLAFVRGNAGARTTTLYVSTALVLLALYVGFTPVGLPTPELLARPASAASLDREQCEKLLQVAQQGGLVLDHSDPARLVVNAAAWEQLPGEISEALSTCANIVRPSGMSETVQIELRGRPQPAR